MNVILFINKKKRHSFTALEDVPAVSTTSEACRALTQSGLSKSVAFVFFIKWENKKMSKYLCWQPLTFADFLPRSSPLSGCYTEVLLLIWPWCISFLSASSSLSVNDPSLWVRCSLKFNPKSSCVSCSHRTELWLVTLDSSLGKKAFLLFCKHQELHDCFLTFLVMYPSSCFLTSSRLFYSVIRCVFLGCVDSSSTRSSSLSSLFVRLIFSSVFFQMNRVFGLSPSLYTETSSYAWMWAAIEASSVSWATEP